MIYFITVLMMEILVGAEIDLFVPSFPDLQRTFGLTPFMVELTLSVNLIAHCATSLVAGNLGDKYGHKPVILWGLGIFIVGSLFCVFAGSFWVLILGRFLQGIGISGPAVLAYLILADMYPIKEQQRLMGIMIGVITTAMAFAPTVGSFVNLFFNWQGNFVILLVMGIVSFAMCYKFIPKGKSHPDTPLSFKSYIPVFQSRKAILYILTICFFVIPYWTFIGISPLLYMGVLKVSLANFGFYQGSLAATFAITSFLSGKLIKRIGAHNAFYGAIGLLSLYLVLTAGMLAFNINDPLLITLSLAIASIAVVFPHNIMWPMSLDSVPGCKGKVSALITCGRLFLAAICIQIVSYFYNDRFFELGLTMCIGYLISYVFGYYLIKNHGIIADMKG